MRLVITGATGYIGQRLVRHALAQGHEVISASRRAPREPVEWLPFDLSSHADFKLPQGVDAVLHLAANTGSIAGDGSAELQAARRLVNAATGSQATFIFVSSQTARADAPTPYGRTKWQIEKLVLAADGLVVRPGQVYGGPELGLFGMLTRTVRDFPVLPAFFPPPLIQPVHVDDLVLALMRCAEREDLKPSIIGVGAAAPISFTSFLKAIASVRLRQGRLWIPVPAGLVRLAARTFAGRPGIVPGLQRLTSLFELPAMRTEDDLAMLGVALRPLQAGMCRSGDDRRRDLISEGRALLAYVLRARPETTLVKRYVRCIETIGTGMPMGLSGLFLRRPAALALLEDDASSQSRLAMDLACRLNAAVVIAEASPQGSQRFLSTGKQCGPALSLLRIARALTLELLWRAGRLLSRAAPTSSTPASKPAK